MADSRQRVNYVCLVPCAHNTAPEKTVTVMYAMGNHSVTTSCNTAQLHDKGTHFDFQLLLAESLQIHFIVVLSECII